MNNNVTDGIVRHENEVLGEPVERKQLVRPSDVEYATWAVNNPQNCLHDCGYCYGRKGSKAQGKIKCDAEWRTPHLVANAVEQVDGELSRKRIKPDRIQLCFMSDPYMWDAGKGAPIPKVTDATNRMVEVINGHGIPVTVLTKGVYPDLDLAALRSDNQYGITVVSLNEEYRQEWEPGSAATIDRIASLKRLSDRGARTWASIEPWPTLNVDSTADDIRPVLEALGFVDKFIFGRMNRVPEVTEYLKRDPRFYEGIAHQFLDWCRENDKAYHVKSGTPGFQAETLGIMSPDYVREIGS